MLFLDELGESRRGTLEALRQPLEDGFVTVSRMKVSATFPARPMLVAATNPCPCGHRGDGTQRCTCRPELVLAYRRRLSGPLLDRLRTLQTAGGAVPSPFDCWLVLRGIRTLPYRVRAQSEHALKIATFLAGKGAKRVDAETVAAISGDLREDSVFLLADRFLEGRRAEALQAAERIFEKGYHTEKGALTTEPVSIALLFIGALVPRLRALRRAHAVAAEGGPCPACGAHLEPGMVECPECGLLLGGVACQRCEAELSPGDEACPVCGHSRGAGAP